MTQPELGQLLFSNGAIQEHGVPRHITADLYELAERVGRSRGDWQFGWGALTSNSGGDEYVNDVFVMRPYCWCDGSEKGHEDQCPPNFEHFASGLIINWYKHAGRGTTANQEVRRSAWRKIIEECLESTGFSEQDVIDQAKAESSQCSVCERSKEDLVQAAGFDGPDEADSLKERGICLGCARRQWDQMTADMERDMATEEEG